MVALAATGESIQPSQPTMPPYTPSTNLPSPPVSKRSPEQPQQCNFRAYSIFRHSGTKTTVAHHHQSTRPPDHDHFTPTAMRSQSGSFATTAGAHNIITHTPSPTNNNRAAPHSRDRYLCTTTTWNHTPTGTQSLTTNKQKNQKKIHYHLLLSRALPTILRITRTMLTLTLIMTICLRRPSHDRPRIPPCTVRQC